MYNCKILMLSIIEARYTVPKCNYIMHLGGCNFGNIINNEKNLYGYSRKIVLYDTRKMGSIFLYASIFDGIQNLETGEMFFYYFPKGILRKEPVNVYEIPNKFNIEEDEYLKLTDDLYKKIKKLKEEFVKVNKKSWTNITISIQN